MSLEGKATAKVVRGKINGLDTLTIDAYGVAVRNGFEGTEEEWLASLKGEKGDKGDRGEKGDAPVKGVDYFTPEDKAELVADIETEMLGDIDTALDSILAIQAELIGGDGV